jgi:hypothetical protein
MKRVLGTILVVLFAVLCAVAQFTVPLGSQGPSGRTKNQKITSRTLTGLVLDKSDHPIQGAVVYLKNTKTLAVKSFFSQKDGSFRFPELPLNTDFEVWAEKDGKKSDVKTLSQFDDRGNPNINLRMDLNK